MTETSTNGTTNEAQATPMYTYYYSTDTVPFKEVFTFKPFDQLPFGFVDSKPDDSLVSPKYDRNLHQWVDVSDQNQAQSIAGLQQQVATLGMMYAQAQAAAQANGGTK